MKTYGRALFLLVVVWMFPTGYAAQAEKRPAVAERHFDLFVTSLKSGSILMLDGTSLMKIFDFPTDGTPTGLTYAENLIFITDQGKHRVLILDPRKKEFLGQIDLAPKSAPKGIACLPNGKLLYVSESCANDIAVIETKTRKVLLRTKVNGGPGQLLVTPSGNFLLCLNVPSGQAGIISTLNQRLMGVVKVGNVPSDLVVSGDSKYAYVSNRMSDSVSIIDLELKRVVGAIHTGHGPTGVTLDNNFLYVANARENTIAAYDLKTRRKTQSAQLPSEIDFPEKICLTPDGKRLLVTSEGTDNIIFLELPNLTVSQKLNIGHPSHDALWIPAGQ